ncbi:protein transport protein Sec16A-like [Salvelinus fontinalis]|uniref:protein transport protein Sec16A-like n=1 Tax=Salvelinus fontinalis TaxID=8038 RepID=UPI002486AF3B|nr:protein transport protein Sec16A-like [Salvelinus fontinalis]
MDTIIPMVAPLWKWDGGACTPPVDFYSKRRDVRLRYVEHPAMMSITKPEHSEANPQCQTGSRPVAEPETPAVHNNSGGWLSWVFGSGRVNKKEVHLPEDKDRSIVRDPTLHRWVNKTEPKAENKCVPPPPPMGTNGYQGNTGSVPEGVNPYSMKAAGLWGSRCITMMGPTQSLQAMGLDSFLDSSLACSLLHTLTSWHQWLCHLTLYPTEV